jgi:hypothetical protein
VSPRWFDFEGAARCKSGKPSKTAGANSAHQRRAWMLDIGKDSPLMKASSLNRVKAQPAQMV